jgi:hypothetical protein
VGLALNACGKDEEATRILFEPPVGADTWTCYLCHTVNMFEFCSSSHCGVVNAKFSPNPLDGAPPSCACGVLHGNTE